MEDDRLNLPNTSAVPFEVLGHKLQFSQEKNCRKGQFCPVKLKGKRVIELGAGCGLAGFGMALLGCDVVSTDQVEVLPLLMKNIERNTSRIMQANHDNLHSASFGSIQAAELDWGNHDHITAVGPPFDYIIGTDIVYSEHLLEPLLKTIVAFSGPRSTVLLGYELRSTIVHDRMIDLWKRNFEVKTVQKSKMDPKYQHASIQLFIMRPKAQMGRVENINQALCEQNGGSASAGHRTGSDDDDDSCESAEKLGNGDNKRIEGNGKIGAESGRRELDEWEVRRYGSIAARLLQEVKIQ